MTKKTHNEVSFTAMVMARTNSTRAPNKNLRPFGETTLVDIALDKLNRLDSVQDRVFAVAEDILAERCENYPNVRVLRRSKESIAKGNAPLRVRFAHYAEIKTDYCIFINPGHPFLSLSTIEMAIDQVRRTRFSSYTSVIPSTERVFNADGDPITHKDPQKTSTTEGEKRFKMAHAMHFISPEVFRQTGTLWTMTRNDPALIHIPEDQALDVDTELDFTLAHLYYHHLKNA